MSVAQHFQPRTFSFDEHEMDTDAHPEDNLDVDIDLGDGVSHAGTDDFMHDDDAQQRLADDEMADDLDYQHEDADGMMQDDQGARDEEIFDAGLDAEGDTELVEAVIDSYDNTTHAYEGDADVEIQDDVEVFEQRDLDEPDQDSALDAINHDAATNAKSKIEAQHNLASAALDHGSRFVEENLVDLNTTELAQQNEDTFTVDDYYATNNKETEAEEVDNLNAEQAPSTESHDSAATNLQQQASLQTSHTSHSDEQPNATTTDKSATPPVIVIFQDSELYLFSTPDRDPTVCLLEDATLLHSNLQELLVACRIMLNDHITEGEMLEMDMADLGLTLSESSSDATVFSLADILDIYVQLLQNDGADMSTALYITITTRPRFTTRMQTLSEAVAQGKGLAQVHAEAAAFEGYESEDVAQDVTSVEDVAAAEEEHESADAANANPDDGTQHVGEHSQPTLMPVPAEAEAEDPHTYNDTIAPTVRDEAISPNHGTREDSIEGNDDLLNEDTEQEQPLAGEDFNEEQPQEEAVGEGEDGVELEIALEEQEQEQVDDEGLYQELSEEAEIVDGPAEANNEEENGDEQFGEQNDHVGHYEDFDPTEPDDLDSAEADVDTAQETITNGHDLVDEDNEGAIHHLNVPHESTNGDGEDDYNDDLDFDEDNISEDDAPDEKPATVDSTQPVLTRKRSRLEDEEEEESPAKKQQLA